MYYQTALSLVSFLMAIGLLLDELRRRDLANLYVSLSTAGDRDWPRTTLRRLDRAITAILGSRIVSPKSVARVFVWSVSINSLIWVSDIYRSNSSHDNPLSAVAIVFLTSTIWAVLTAFIHDYVSVSITRLIMRRTIGGSHLGFLGLDIGLSYLLLSSTYGLQQSALIAFKFGHIHPNAATMLWRYWWYVVWGSIRLDPVMPSQSWHFAALLCAVSALVPTLCYLAALVGMMVLKRASKLGAVALEWLSKGGPRFYTTMFGLLSVVTVLGALIVDMFRV